MVEHLSYLIGAQSKLVSFHSAAGCNDDDAMIAARTLPAASVTIEWQLTRMVATPARSHQCATRGARLDSRSPRAAAPNEGPVSHV
jgi:hypothetical protein